MLSAFTSTVRLRWFVAGWAGAVILAAGARANAPQEYQVKAAFLYNFTKFVEWPPESFPGSNAPLIIGVLGRNPFGDELEKLVRGRTVNGHPIAVLYLPTVADAKLLPNTCHVLFVGAGEETMFARLARPPPGAGRLTVGESGEFAARGIVNFVVIDAKVRFEINADAADYAGLKISAQLQKLATAVHRKS